MIIPIRDNSFTNFNVMRNFNFNTDHKLILGEISIIEESYKCTSQNGKKPEKKLQQLRDIF